MAKERNYKRLQRHYTFDGSDGTPATGLTVETGRRLFRWKPVNRIVSEIDAQITAMPESQRDVAKMQAAVALYDLAYRRSLVDNRVRLPIFASALASGAILGLTNPVGIAVFGTILISHLAIGSNSSFRVAELKGEAAIYATAVEGENAGRLFRRQYLPPENLNWKKGPAPKIANIK